jgi:anthranilate synthase component 2
MILLIDNYDSFTFNLVHYLGELGQRVRVERNDALGLADIRALDPRAIVLSPGPCTPDDAGVCLDVLRELSPEIPTFGVCLGHQAMGQAHGGKVIRAPSPVHGKTSRIHHQGRGVFRGLNGPFDATRYHSLIVRRDDLPEALEVTAETEDGLIMGLSHREHCVHGVQFHPESIASEHGHRILKSFLDLASVWNSTRRPARAA